MSLKLAIKIKHFSILQTIFFFSLIIVVEAHARDWKLIKPESGKKITLLVADKNRTYYELDKINLTVVRAIGPGLLKVYTRPVFSGETEIEFSVLIDRDSQKKYDLSRVTGPSGSVRNISQPSLIIGNSPKEFRFKIPPGEHIYSFKLPRELERSVYARFLVSEDEPPDIDYIAILPRAFSEEVAISVKEKEYLFHRGTQLKPIEIELIGPTRIKSVARLEFDYSMRGLKPYRIQVFESDSLIITQPLEAHISGTATYVKTSPFVLGHGNKFYIDVPGGGKHRYKILVPDIGHSVLFRFYIPAKDLHNTPSDGLSDGVGYLKFLKRNRTG